MKSILHYYFNYFLIDVNYVISINPSISLIYIIIIAFINWSNTIFGNLHTVSECLDVQLSESDKLLFFYNTIY
jgi:hypothetical protein